MGKKQDQEAKVPTRTLEMPRAVLLGAMESAKMFVAGYEDRPALTGVKLECEGPELRVTAADGFILQELRLTVDTGPDVGLVIAPDALVPVLQGWRTRKVKVTLAHNTFRLTDEWDEAQASFPVMHYPYPDVSEIMLSGRTGEPTGRAALGSTLLGRATKSMARLNAAEVYVRTALQPNPSGFFFDGYIEQERIRASIIAMPLQLSWPLWIEAGAAEEAQA